MIQSSLNPFVPGLVPGIHGTGKICAASRGWPGQALIFPHKSASDNEL